MRWFIVFSLFFICFSTQAQVVCKDPNSAGGDEVAEAGSSSSLCRTNVTDASQGAVDRDLNNATHLANLDPGNIVEDTDTPAKDNNNEAGSDGSIK